MTADPYSSSARSRRGGWRQEASEELVRKVTEGRATAILKNERVDLMVDQALVAAEKRRPEPRPGRGSALRVTVLRAGPVATVGNDTLSLKS